MSKETNKPSQYYIDEKWDSAIDTMLRRVVYGSLAGGLAAVILFRKYKTLCSACDCGRFMENRL
jgi:hypothetical protein